jgi:uncharacterized membrane protein
MNPVLEIALWGILFVATHLVLSSAAVRPRLVAILGAQPFRGVYSLVAAATLIPLIVTFAHHQHAGPMFWFVREIASLHVLTVILMFAALIFLTGSFVSPNPAQLGAPSEARVRGILKITRHPGFMAFILFGLAHMIMNGWLGDILFFGTFVVLGVAGGIHQDGRKLRELGEPYRRFMAETSFVPGAALISGRQRISAADMPWAAIGIGAALAIVLGVAHPVLFGGHPFG